MKNNSFMTVLAETAKSLVAPGKGVFAADWGVESVGLRFAKINLSNTEESRKRYREMLFATAGLSQYISGVIEFDETLRQAQGMLPKLLKQNGIIPGVKVDRGVVDQAFFAGEKITEGMDGLRQRLMEYKKLGAEFCKWRAVITIGPGTPTRTNISANMTLLAQYAALCQEQELVSIVEPEVLMDGEHTVEKCAEVTELVHRSLFELLLDYKVDLGGLILKTNMVVAGKNCPQQPSQELIAQKTIEVLQKTVSVAVPGVVFLSGGQTAVEATKNLNAIGLLATNLPWKLTFSFERALEEPALATWAGKDENKEAAQKVLLHRAKMNSLASLGKYSEEVEHEI